MIVSLDFETFYDNTYSLRRMSEVDYVLSPLFETIMCAVKLGDRPTMVATTEASIRVTLASIDWSKTALLNHNSRFDGAILAWRYGYMPAMYLDTLSMARAMTHAHAGSSSLAGVAKYLSLPPKGDAVLWAKGMRRSMFTKQQLQEYADYCVQDTELTYKIFQEFIAAGFPKRELKVIDLSLRKFVEPQVCLNTKKLELQLQEIQTNKAKAFQQVSHLDKSVFSSNQKFAKLLEEHGIDVPTKISPTTGEEIPALAKNDWAFKELCADDNLPDLIKLFLACRVGAKSTIDESRTMTLLNLSQQSWGNRLISRGWMPVPYKYYGAHTGRFSGDGGYNFANLRRGAPVREAIEPPPGYVVVHRDSSQIEARMLAWVAHCDYLVKAFAGGRDIYSEFATKFYGFEVTKADVPRRFAGKTAILSLGYGCGANKFRHALFIGNGGISLRITEDDARGLVYFYRDMFSEIPRLWRSGEAAIAAMMGVRTTVRDAELPIRALELDYGCVWLPNGLPIQYPRLHTEQDRSTQRTEAYYHDPYGARTKLYGAKFIENITQALARIVVTEIELRVYARTGYRPFMSTYDSHEYLVPHKEAQAFDRILEQEFSVAPSWAPGLPLASEGGWGFNLLDAEHRKNP